MRARRVAFPKGRAWSFIAGKGFSLGHSRVSSSIGSFLPPYKIVQDCCCHNNCKGSGKFCSNGHGETGE